MSAKRYCLGVIGGSGLDAMHGVETVGDPATVHTPYGDPSGPIVRARTEHADLLFLPRHGLGHRIPPHAVNYRANICALRTLGATHVLSVSAVGSLRQSIAPGHLVAVNQIMDRTWQRVATFFDEPGVVAHVGFADPICPALHTALLDAARAGAPEATLHPHGTLVVIEGPRFSSRAESEHYRSLNANVIGMTAMPEAALAREAELPYAILALSTDYDCWHRGEEAVTAGAVAAIMRKNVVVAQAVIGALVARLPDPAASPATRCLDAAIMTDPMAIPLDARERLAWLRPFSPMEHLRRELQRTDVPADS